MTDVIRAEWYDVEEAEEAEFLSRLHSEFLPRVRSLAGVAWVGHYRIAPKAANGTTDAPTRHETSDPTVPKGSQFVLDCCGEPGSATPSLLRSCANGA